MINYPYLLPYEILQPFFYNELIEVENVPFFNELKNNYSLIKEELLCNFNNMTNVTTDDFLYVNLDDYVISKSNNKPANEKIIGYSMFISDFIKFYLLKKNDLILENKKEIEKILKIENEESPLDNNRLSLFMSLVIEKSEKEITKKEIEKLKLIQKVKIFCPFTYGLIKKMKDEAIMTNCFISCLKSDSYIKPHNDYLDTSTIRVHYCLTTDEKCKITVGTETREWKENDFLIFDANGQYKHSIDHDGEKDRVVMIFDLKKDYLWQFKKRHI